MSAFQPPGGFAAESCKPSQKITWNGGTSTSTSTVIPSDSYYKPAGRVNIQLILEGLTGAPFSAVVVVEGTLDEGTAAGVPGNKGYWCTIGTFMLSCTGAGLPTEEVFDTDNFVCDVPYRGIRVNPQSLVGTATISCLMGNESWAS